MNFFFTNTITNLNKRLKKIIKNKQQNATKNLLKFYYLSFLLLNSLLDNSILTFIIVILLTAFDFYLTKNISGRFLVGLRWWNDFKDDGTEIWIFESYDSPQKRPSSVDAAFFWTSQIGSLAVWALFVFVDVISFKIYWVLVSGTAMVLNGVNFWGFYKCRGGKKLNEIFFSSRYFIFRTSEKGKGLD